MIGFLGRVPIWRMNNNKKSLPTFLYLVLVSFPFIYILFNFIYFFSFGFTGSSLLCGLFSSCSKPGLLSKCNLQASHCSGFSCWGVWALGEGFSSWDSRALEHRLSSCGKRAWLHHSMKDLPKSGIKPTSPALAGGVFTAELPGKPIFIFLHCLSC